MDLKWLVFFIGRTPIFDWYVVDADQIAYIMEIHFKRDTPTFFIIDNYSIHSTWRPYVSN